MTQCVRTCAPRRVVQKLNATASAFEEYRNTENVHENQYGVKLGFTLPPVDGVGRAVALSALSMGYCCAGCVCVCVSGEFTSNQLLGPMRTDRPTVLPVYFGGRAVRLRVRVV